jgi:hypothetical protein
LSKALFMKQFLSFICLCMLAGLTSCMRMGNANSEESSAELTTFKGIPRGVDGCTCYFAASEKKFQNEEYLFVSNLDSSAYVSINGKPLALKLVSTTRSWAMDDRDYLETYSDGMYTVTIHVYFKGSSGDEAWWNSGDIKVYFKGVEMDKRSFMGECGC